MARDNCLKIAPTTKQLIWKYQNWSRMKSHKEYLQQILHFQLTDTNPMLSHRLFYTVAFYSDPT